jgi:hypothetical protein
MKNLLVLLIILMIYSCSTERSRNLSDIEDRNEVPSELEVLDEDEERIKVYDDPLFESLDGIED